MDKSEQAHAESETLRTLSKELASFASKIERLDGDLRGALAHLGQTFRDEEYERFRTHYAGSSAKLRSFVELIRGLTPQLDRDVEALVAAEQVKLDF